MSWKALVAAVLMIGVGVCANPFFAMDTAVRSLSELDVVKELGYAGISWKIGEPSQAAAVAEQVRQHGLKLFAMYSYTHATLTKTNLLLDPNIAGVMTALKGTDTVIWLPISSKDFAVSSAAGDAVAVPALQQLSDLAASNGVRVAIYPHKGCWIERIQDAVRVVRQVNQKNCGVTFNLCHCLMVGDEAKIPELLTEAAPYLFLVTINGADKDPGKPTWPRVIQPLDQGSYDVGIVLKKLKELNYSGPIGLQGYNVTLPPKENLTRSMTAWKKLNAAASD